MVFGLERPLSYYYFNFHLNKPYCCSLKTQPASNNGHICCTFRACHQIYTHNVTLIFHRPYIVVDVLS